MVTRTTTKEVEKVDAVTGEVTKVKVERKEKVKVLRRDWQGFEYGIR